MCICVFQVIISLEVLLRCYNSPLSSHPSLACHVSVLPPLISSLYRHQTTAIAEALCHVVPPPRAPALATVTHLEDNQFTYKIRYDLNGLEPVKTENHA
jgi:hypothetical protein